MEHKQYAVHIPDSFNPNREWVNMGYFDARDRAVTGGAGGARRAWRVCGIPSLADTAQLPEGAAGMIDHTAVRLDERNRSWAGAVVAHFRHRTLLLSATIGAGASEQTRELGWEVSDQDVRD